jgi:hypothetical protein
LVRLPASNCTAAAPNGGASDTYYSYDAHRVPMRIALDYCFNATAAAKTYATKVGGTAASGTAVKSASAIGAAGLAAMADGSNTVFINDAYHTVFDLAIRGTLETTTTYTYHNATAAMLTLLIMTGNFSH